MTLAPPPVAIGDHDSFHTASLRPPSAHARQAGLDAPVEVKASLPDGVHAQPSCSRVPPAETTYGELAGHHTVRFGPAPLFLQLADAQAPEAARPAGRAG